MAFGRGLPASLNELEQRLADLAATVAGRPAFLSDVGTPAPALGINGDHYLNSTNGELYQKVGGTWSFLGQVWFDTTQPDAGE